MNKLTKSAVALSMLLSGPVMADTILGVYAGAQYWNTEVTGGFSSADNNIQDFGFDKENNVSFDVALEHPVPFLPNVKIRRNALEHAGVTTLSQTLEFEGKTYSINTQVGNDIDLSNTDYVLYYELFDNDLLSIDFGIAGKDFDGDLQVVNLADTTQRGRTDLSGIVPMVYLSAEVGMPFTGLSVFADGMGLSIGDHSIYDYQAGIAYQFIDNMAVDVRVELGYRALTIELSDLDDIYANLDFKGVYTGLRIHF